MLANIQCMNQSTPQRLLRCTFVITTLCLLLLILTTKASATFTFHESPRTLFSVRENNNYLLLNEHVLRPDTSSFPMTSPMGAVIEYDAIAISEASPVHSAVGAGVTLFSVDSAALGLSHSASASARRESRYSLDYGEVLDPGVVVGFAYDVVVAPGEELFMAANVAVRPDNDPTNSVSFVYHLTFSEPGVYSNSMGFSVNFENHWYRQSLIEHRPLNSDEREAISVSFDLYSGVGITITRTNAPLATLAAHTSHDQSLAFASTVNSAVFSVGLQREHISSAVPEPGTFVAMTTLFVACIGLARREYRRSGFVEE